MTEQTTSRIATTTKTRMLENLLAALVAVGVTAALALPVAADPRQSIPLGYTDDFLVIMASGVVDDNQQPNAPFHTCTGSVCDGEYFHKVVMGRSDAEILALEQDAKAFYLQRFGFDVDAPANVGRIVFKRYTSHPDMNYRVYVQAGERVPAEGWHFYDGGWVVTITDPAGYTLGGEWAGYHANQNALFFFGNYQFLKTNKQGHIVDRQDIFYRAGAPLNVDTGSDASFKCELSLDDQLFSTGVHGVAQGIASAYPIGPGALKLAIRNVITFGPSSVRPGLGPDCISGPIPLIGGGFYEGNLCDSDDD